jgi:2-hydroxycyclohexanecarboxyl-CoA dehydrogenase
MSQEDFAGRVVVITGGSVGIGRGIGELIARRGGTVVVLDRNEPDPDAGYTPPMFIQTDVGDRAQVDEAFRQAAERGPIWGLANAALWQPPAVAAEDLTAEVVERCFRVAVLGSLYCCQAAFPHMKKTGGRILNFGSDLTARPLPGQLPYVIAKGSIQTLTRSLATEWGEYGITVNTLWPLAATPAWLRWAKARPEDERALIERDIPLRRRGDADTDVAPLGAFLLSAGSQWITGSVMTVNGGRVMY